MNPQPSDNPLPPMPPANSSQPAAVAASDVPELADDGDLIEKEWVQQAKQIIQTTANDPFEQNAQFTQLRAKYLQKRYGKQLKVDS